MRPKGRTALVATAGPGDGRHNTLVLAGIELVIPLEADLDGDPSKPDCVRLRGDDGGYEVELTAGGPGVERDGDTPLYRYHFHEVPVGTYGVDVKVRDAWVPVLEGLRVSHEGAFVGETSFEAESDGDRLGTPEDELEDESSDEAGPEEDPGCAS